MFNLFFLVPLLIVVELFSMDPARQALCQDAQKKLCSLIVAVNNETKILIGDDPVSAEHGQAVVENLLQMLNKVTECRDDDGKPGTFGQLPKLCQLPSEELNALYENLQRYRIHAPPVAQRSRLLSTLDRPLVYVAFGSAMTGLLGAFFLYTRKDG